MSKAVGELKMNLNVDTNTDDSLFEASARLKIKEKLRADDRFPTFIIDRLIKDSPIGKFFTQELQISLLGGLFKLRNHKTILVLQNMERK